MFDDGEERKEKKKKDKHKSGLLEDALILSVNRKGKKKHREGASQMQGAAPREHNIDLVKEAPKSYDEILTDAHKDRLLTKE